MKREIMGFIAGILVTVSVTAAYANPGIRLVINGVDNTSTLDVAPQIVNDRVMVPLRYVAENLGATVNWDAATATVSVVTAKPSTGTTTPTTPSTTGTTVAVYGATIDKSTYEEGETAVIKVTANRVATKVKAVTSTGELLAESTDYTSDSQGNYFTLYVKLDEPGTQSIRIYSGNSTGYGTSSKTLSVTVKEKAVVSTTISVNSVTLEDSTVEEGDTVYATVKTSTNVVKIVIEDNDGKSVVSKTKTSSTTSSVYTWELSFKADGDEGSNYFYAYAYDANGKSEYKRFTLTIDDGGTSSSKPVISDVEVDENELDYGDYVYMTVKTNTAVEYVYVESPDGHREFESNSYTRKIGSYLYWDIDFTVYDDGNYYVYAGNDDYSDVSYKVRLYVD